MNFIKESVRSYRTYFNLIEHKKINYFNHKHIKKVLMIVGLMLSITLISGYLLGVLDSIIYIILSINFITVITSYIYLYFCFPEEKDHKFHFIFYTLFKWMTSLMIYQSLFLFLYLSPITPNLFLIIFQVLTIIMIVFVFIYEYLMHIQKDAIYRIAATSLVLYLCHVSLISLLNMTDIYLSFILSSIVLFTLFVINKWFIYLDRSFNRWVKDNFVGMMTLLVGIILYIAGNISTLYEKGQFLSFWRRDLIIENQIHYRSAIDIQDDHIVNLIEYKDAIYLQTDQKIDIYHMNYTLKDTLNVTDGYMIETNLGIALIVEQEDISLQYTVFLLNDLNIFEHIYTFNHHNRLYVDYIYFIDHQRSIFMHRTLSNYIFYFDGTTINHSMNIDDLLVQEDNLYLHIYEGRKVFVHQKYGAYTMNYIQENDGVSIKDEVIQYRGQDYYYVAYGHGSMIYKDLHNTDFLYRSAEDEKNFNISNEWSIYAKLFIYHDRVYFVSGSTFFKMNLDNHQKTYVTSKSPRWVGENRFYMYDHQTIYTADMNDLFVYKKVTTHSVQEYMMFIGFLIISMTWSYGITQHALSKKGEPS